MMDKKEWEKKSEIISMVNFFFFEKKEKLYHVMEYMFIHLVCVKRIHQIKKYVVHNILRFKEWVMKKKKNQLTLSYVFHSHFIN